MINKVTIIGNAGNNPEIRHGGGSNGWTNAKISVATTKKWKDKDGNWQEKTNWHRVIAWGRLAEYLEQYAQKGTLLYIEGSIEYGKYEKDGATVYTTDIVANHIKIMAKGKGSNENSGYGRQDSYPEPPPMGDDVPF